MQTVKLTSGLYIDSRTIMGPNTQFNITLMIWRHENQTTAWKTTTTTSVCLFVCLVLTRTEPMSWPSPRCVETWHIGSLTVNTEPGHMLHAGPPFKQQTVFLYALSREQLSGRGASLASRWAVIVSVLPNKSWSWPGKINMPLDDFKCGCFLHLWSYKGPSITAVRPPSLTAAAPLNCVIKGFHRESMKAALIPVSSRLLTPTMPRIMCEPSGVPAFHCLKKSHSGPILHRHGSRQEGFLLIVIDEMLLLSVYKSLITVSVGSWPLKAESVFSFLITESQVTVDVHPGGWYWRQMGFLPSIPRQRTGNWWPQNDQLMIILSWELFLARLQDIFQTRSCRHNQLL